MKIEYFGISSRLIQINEKIGKVFCESLSNSGLTLKTGDIIVISSKIVALEQGLVVNLDSIPLHPKAEEFVQDTGINKSFISLIIRESDIIFGGVPGALLTMRDGVLQANAGIDRSNTPKGTAILPPNNPEKFANEFLKNIEEKFNVKAYVLVIDSATRPLRRGTTGLCLGASSNFPAVVDDRGSVDLLGNKMNITTRAIADNVATGANLVMGESDQSIPFVLVRNAPVNEWLQKTKQNVGMKIELDQCLYFKNFNKNPLYRKID